MYSVVWFVKGNPSEKNDVFSTEENGDTRRKVAHFSALTLALNVGSWAVQG
jgi:hypothetical protein